MSSDYYELNTRNVAQHSYWHYGMLIVLDHQLELEVVINNTSTPIVVVKPGSEFLVDKYRYCLKHITCKIQCKYISDKH